MLTRDRDQKFGKAFDGALRAKGITPVRLPHCAPNLNAHVEQFIQMLQNECLDRFTVAGTSHLDLLMREFVEHYNRERPHSSIGYRPPAGACTTSADWRAQRNDPLPHPSRRGAAALLQMAA